MPTVASATRYDTTIARSSGCSEACIRTPDVALVECSAIMTRAYRDLPDFPAWFFNLPPPNDSWPIAADRPPGATVIMRAHGYITVRDAGTLEIDTGTDVKATMSVDGAAIDGATQF